MEQNRNLETAQLNYAGALFKTFLSKLVLSLSKHSVVSYYFAVVQAKQQKVEKTGQLEITYIHCTAYVEKVTFTSYLLQQ